MSQDTPRNDVDPDDRLLDFDSEASNSALDKKEPDIALRGTERDSAVGGEEPEIFFNRQEPDITPGQPDITPGQPNVTPGQPDTQPDAHALPLHAPPVQPFVWYTSDPVVHKSARLNIGIALLVLVSIGALAWSGRLLMAMRRDAGASAAQIQNASQPTPTVPPEAPANVLPPAPEPQPPATDVPARSEPRVPAQTATPSAPATAIATPSEAPRPKAPDAPRAARPAPQAERLPVNAAPNAAGGLFAITRPVGAQVFVDNKLIGTTPLFMSQLSSGSHEVRLELPGFKTQTSSIQVEPNSRFRLAVQLEETP